MIVRRAISYALLTMILSATVLSGCNKDSTISKVGDWIVSFAAKAGKFVAVRAKTFADAVTRAWEAFRGQERVKDVLVNSADKLKGTYDGNLHCKVEWGGASGGDARKNELSISLDHPHMVRDSETSEDWNLAPEDRAKIDLLQKQLLQPN